MKYVALFVTSLCLLSPPAWSMDGSEPIASDSRIKTFVYNENDVYPITTLFGYQSNIEFGLKEEIETISLGDRVGWQIIPSGRRLFIRPMLDSNRTNMTIITNRRSYQFDLKSVSPGAVSNDELIYVARFYYPDEQPQPPIAAGSVSPDALVQAAAGATYNYNYTYSGPDNAAPLKIFDDGHSTFLKLRDAGPASVAVVQPDGSERPVTVRNADGYVVVPVVTSRLTLHQGAAIICVFNEASGR